MPAYRYSRWNGNQQVFELDDDALLESLSEDILAHGDVNRALRDLLRRGPPNEACLDRPVRPGSALRFFIPLRIHWVAVDI